MALMQIRCELGANPFFSLSVATRRGSRYPRRKIFRQYLFQRNKLKNVFFSALGSNLNELPNNTLGRPYFLTTSETCFIERY